MAEKPTIVFVPGAFHTPVHYQSIIEELSKLAYPSLCVSLPLIGAEASDDIPITASLNAVQGTLTRLVTNEDKRVLVVCHSAGGNQASQAVKGLERSRIKPTGGNGGILGIVFMAAWMIQEGDTLVTTVLGGLPDWAEIEGKFLRPSKLCEDLFFHDVAPVERSAVFEALKPMVAGGAILPVKNTCWDTDLPKTYIITTDDHALSPKIQEQMFERMKDHTWTQVRIHTGHAPWLSKQMEVIQILEEAMHRGYHYEEHGQSR